MATELISHRRKHPIPIASLITRAQAGDQRMRDDGSGYIEIDRFCDRPPSFARVRDKGGNVGQFAVLLQGLGCAAVLAGIALSQRLGAAGKRS